MTLSLGLFLSITTHGKNNNYFMLIRINLSGTKKLQDMFLLKNCVFEHFRACQKGQSQRSGPFSKTCLQCKWLIWTKKEKNPVKM